MQRLTIVLTALIGVLAGGLAISLLMRPAPVTDTAAVRAIVAEMIAEAGAEAKPPLEIAKIDPAVLKPMIEEFLMSNPRILERVSNALEAQVRTAARAEAKAQIAALQSQIYEDADHVVLGNPDGDVTLVEMFDYNCTYCRAAMPDLATLLAEDPNLKVILKEFPILSKESVDAARISVLVGQSDADYWAFHQALFTGRGQVTKEAALAAADGVGLNPVELELGMQSEAVSAVIQKSYELARALNITGTPTYIIGDELIPGAIGLEGLRDRIANMRACGSTQCEG